MQESTVMRFLVSLFALLFPFLNLAWAQNAPFPPSPRQLVAVNPVTNKVYVANESANTVTVIDQSNNTTATIPVGNRPQFIVVNPLTNRIFVNNGADASLTVIDGGTDTVVAPAFPVGSQGPMAINNETNVVYIVRMTSVATDEVSFFNATNNTWYTIATESFQPTALTINPNTNTLYVAHYGTGDVRVISGEFNNTVLHPTTSSIPAWSKPFAIAANSMTNKVYVITEDSRGPIGVIDGATNTPTWLTPSAGHATSPKALAVNPVTNKVYAAFANEVVVIDGGTNSLTYVPVPTGSVASIAINYFTNKIYVSNDGGNLTVIDGFTNATTALAVPAGTISIGMNPMTNEIITGGSTAAAVDGVTAPFIGLPLTTSITPLPGNSGTTGGTITMSASNGFPNPLPVRGVYYQFDSIEGRWALATGAGNGPWTAPLSGLSSGSHTIYAFAAEAHMAPIDTGNGSSPLFGNITSYAFTVTATTGATVGVTSSVNPSTVGQSVTFTARVTGDSGTPTGTVTFLDGSTPLCSAVALAAGSATCTTSALTAGSHTINASYSGSSTYGSASGSVAQTVNKLSATVALGSTPNPSTPGQSVTITANVTGSGAMPTGTVTFLDGATTLCSAVAVASGSATCTTSSLTTGAHTLNASYSGNGTYNTASGTASHSVGTATATVGVTASANPSIVGQSVTFTATVSGSSGTPTGTVSFTDGATPMCSGVTLASGKATCTSASLGAGSHTITASYSGSSSYGASNGSVTQTVNQPGPAAKSEITSPAPGSTLSGDSVTLTWSAGSQVLDRYLAVGSSPGSGDLFSGYVSSATSRTVTGLPTDGRTIYVQLSSWIAGGWQAATATYTASGSGGGTPPTPTASSITSPSPGATLSGPTETFTWDAGSGVTERYLSIGSSAGSGDLYSAYAGGTTSRTVSGLPTDGRTIYVQLSSWLNGSWVTKTYTYTASGTGSGPPPSPTPSTITSPAAGSMLTSTTVTFSWTQGSGVTERYLTVGTSPGASDVYAGYQGAATSRTVSGLPSDGRTVYVQLSSWIGGGWQGQTYSYTSTR
jgi:YVTN family beta-propeller protein